MSRGVTAPNSFVLPTHEVDVSLAPKLGLMPLWIYSYLTNPARFFNVLSEILDDCLRVILSGFL